LINTINKLKANDVPELMMKVNNWADMETKKENAKRNPSEPRLIAIQDRKDCLAAFMEDAKTVQEVIDKINSIFSDESKGGIRLSSIHKAKGLEAERVFLLQLKGASVPHPMAKSSWQRQQESHLLYVAITRARNELVYVS